MTTQNQEGEGTVVGKLAPDFTLFDPLGEAINLANVCKKGPVMLAFYPGDFTPVCTKQLCNYRDNLPKFGEFGLQIFGISKNKADEHQKFDSQYSFEFKLLTDPKNQIAKLFDCGSKWMLGRISRAVFIINTKRIILHRYVEPTAISHRSANELMGVLRDLKTQQLI